MTAPLPSPATDFTGRTGGFVPHQPGIGQHRHLEYRWQVSLAPDKPGLCLFPQARHHQPAGPGKTYGLGADHSPFRDPSPSFGSGTSPNGILPPSMVFRPLVLGPLDRVQRRAQRLVRDKRPHHAPDSFQPSRNAGMWQGLKFHAQGTKFHTPHLANHQAPQATLPFTPPVSPHTDRSRTGPFLQDRAPPTFLLTRYGRLWN
ncbi:hypothetical protein GWK47_027672 [Chionoecetes opilio]|uniref:Uncharacterized protein n=1 Tax=Chionoecetes opilio TaxID=41210 RepID=A0A8J8W9V5_CHIOP|nr:hypothetical protein GWK47_027672 [Chionoecetes opilio]